MTAVEIIRDIHEHGGTVIANGGDLTLTARRPLPADLVEMVRTRKSELLAHLTIDAANTIADPTAPCPACGFGQWWQLPGEAWRCRRCKPMRDDLSGRATTLTLPCHEVQTRPVRDPTRLRRMVALACRGLKIKPDQLWTELETSGDLADLESVSVRLLREVARTLNVLRRLPGC
jgi:hypothetical protein